MKVVLFLMCIFLVIDIYTNTKLYKSEKEMKILLEKNNGNLKEKIEVSKELNYNVKLAIQKDKNTKKITIEELTEQVIKEINNELKKSLDLIRK